MLELKSFLPSFLETFEGSTCHSTHLLLADLALLWLRACFTCAMNALWLIFGLQDSTVCCGTGSNPPPPPGATLLRDTGSCGTMQMQRVHSDRSDSVSVMH